MSEPKTTDSTEASDAPGGNLSPSLGSAWLPIETAPKDGTKILSYTWNKDRSFGTETIKGGHTFAVTEWKVIVGTQEEDLGNGTFRKIPKTHFEGWLGSYFQFMPMQIHPSHWMPLPLPPNNPVRHDGAKPRSCL